MSLFYLFNRLSKSDMPKKQIQYKCLELMWNLVVRHDMRGEHCKNKHLFKDNVDVNFKVGQMNLSLYKPFFL